MKRLLRLINWLPHATMGCLFFQPTHRFEWHDSERGRWGFLHTECPYCGKPVIPATYLEPLGFAQR